MIFQARDLFDLALHVNFVEFKYPEFLISGGVRNKMLTKLTALVRALT